MLCASIRTTCVVASVLLCSATACNDDDVTTRSGGEAGDSAGGASLGPGGSGSVRAEGGASGAAGNQSGGAPDELEVITIRFKATVGDADSACRQVYDEQGTTGATVEPQDFRFFVENVRLIRCGRT